MGNDNLCLSHSSGGPCTTLAATSPSCLRPGLWSTCLEVPSFIATVSANYGCCLELAMELAPNTTSIIRVSLLRWRPLTCDPPPCASPVSLKSPSSFPQNRPPAFLSTNLQPNSGPQSLQSWSHSLLPFCWGTRHSLSPLPSPGAAYSLQSRTLRESQCSHPGSQWPGHSQPLCQCERNQDGYLGSRV